jgi:hypothetical protein
MLAVAPDQVPIAAVHLGDRVGSLLSLKSESRGARLISPTPLA